MPYIAQDRREALAQGSPAQNPGELSFIFAKVIIEYMLATVPEDGVLRYQQVNDILGALDGTARDFYRRVVTPFEDAKIRQNGDVWFDPPPAEEEKPKRGRRKRSK